MHYYSFLKMFLPLFILFYFSASVYLGPYPSDIPFPFFSWFLFSAPPSKIRELPTIRIVASEEKTLPKPVFLRNAKEFVDLQNNGPTVLEAVIGRLAGGIQNGDEKRIQEQRTILESYFLSPRLTYEVVIAKYDLIEYLTEGKVREGKVLVTFTTNHKP